MLPELLTWLATPALPEARRLGYLKAAIGLQSRAMRCRAAWDSHLQHCQEAIRRSVAGCPIHRTALVLGSGIGLEYPLPELATTFERVILADIVHLPVMRRSASKFRNVELLTVDLTGLAKPLLEVAAGTSPLEIDALAVAPALPSNITDTLDWTVSCNLLSQLPMLPVAWLQRHYGLNVTDQERIGRAIMVRHLEWLGSLAGTRCLIADAEQTVSAPNGNCLERTDLAAAFDLDRYAFAGWEWHLAPSGELPDGLSAVHRVVACEWPAGYSSAAPAPSGNKTSV